MTTPNKLSVLHQLKIEKRENRNDLKQYSATTETLFWWFSLCSAATDFRSINFLVDFFPACGFFEC
jgi:hypothetical protein